MAAGDVIDIWQMRTGTSRAAARAALREVLGAAEGRR